ncbi:MAG: GTPase Era [Candidatus Omnitrophica bacterium]|nr:GTPase Era [Candidatus Omnitrophota bacterium]
MSKKKVKVEVEEKNEELSLKTGVATIVGRPNVGKSTLVNKILGEKIAIVSNIPQTTRNQIRGVYNDERGQIVFIDTPGLHLGHDKLDKFMNRASMGSLQDVDVVIHLVDTTEHVGVEERNVVDQLKDLKCPIILGLNKVDIGKGKFIPDYITLWEETKGKKINEIKNLTLLPLSGMTGVHIDKLVDLVFEHLTEGPLHYDRDTVCDYPRKMVFSDTIREKLFQTMREEVPHSIAVVIEETKPRKGKTLYIRAVILVERDSQKEIVIGKNGAVLKKVGMEARKELEDLLEQKVFLEMFVKTEKKWREDHGVLEQMGYIY